MSDEELHQYRLSLALEAAGLDLWENNLLTGEVTLKAIKTLTELGYEVQEMAAYVDDIYLLLHPDDTAVVRRAVDDHLSGRTPHYRCEFRLRAKDGSWLWYANYGKVMDTHSSSPGQRFVGVTFNINDRKRKEDELSLVNQQLAEQNAMLQNYNAALELLASCDPLTGLANRRRLMDLGINEIKRTERFNHALSLLMVDIDCFKDVNDAWGHQVGDRVICAVADLCDARIRSGLDTAARVGGEEFVIMLPETDHLSAHVLAESLRQAVAALRVLADDGISPVTFTVSIGIATQEGGRLSFDQLINNADKALYQAKRAGRNNVQGFSGSILASR